MFQFEQISGMYLLIIIPILVLIIFVSLNIKKRSIAKLGSPALLEKLLPNWSYVREWTKAILLVLSAAFLFISWANPQWGTKTEKIKAKRSDVVIALDISQSMLAEDISPNRLECAKRMAGDLVEALKGNRIGLIYFAGSAYLQMPLTSDFAAAQLFLKTANTNQAGTQGTAIADAIDLSISAFSAEEKSQKAVIIISDGENHDQEAIDAAKKARDEGAYIYTIGVGTEAGDLVPYYNGANKQYKVDKAGTPVKSKLNIKIMQDIASAGGGEAYLLNEGAELIADLEKQLEKIEKFEVEQRSFTDYESYFQYFLGFGIFLLILEFILSKGKHKNLKKKNIIGI